MAGQSLTRRTSFNCVPRPCVWRKCCAAPSPALLYYGETRRRTPVRFSPELRRQVQSAAEEMHQLFRRGHTPKAGPGKILRRLLSEGAVPAAADPAGVRIRLSEPGHGGNAMRQLLNTLFVTSEDIYLSLDGENVVASREHQEAARYRSIP